MMKKLMLLIIFFISMQQANLNPALAHGNEKHKKNATSENTKSQAGVESHDTVTLTKTEKVELAVSPAEHAMHEQEPASVHASLSDFPNKHPLIVHFPIVLLLVAAAVQLANIFLTRKELNWVTTICVLVSFSAAYYVTKIDHPHTSGLSAHTKLVLAQHDLYADWTIYLAGFALVAQLVNQFIFKGKRWSTTVVALVLVGAAYCVSMAGHYGSQLVYLEGVGPQGKYLDSAHDH